MTPRDARRLAIVRQRLAGSRPPGDAAGILDVFRDLGCVQIDPIRAVERTQFLVLWSRLGRFDREALDRLLWQDRLLFEYWSHDASIVLSENYALHRSQMRQFRDGYSLHARRTCEWLAKNPAFRRYVLSQVRKRGPLAARDFEDRAAAGWKGGGWNNEQSVSVSMMLRILWVRGELLVAERNGLHKKWALPSQVFPKGRPANARPVRNVVREAAQIALRALGVAPLAHIRSHFIRGFYPELERELAALQRQKRIVPVDIDGDGFGRGTWFIHADDVPLLERLQRDEWQPRTTLLSPFDNLICNRTRTRQLFDFDYTIEIYVPAAKRRYGYYVLPILHGDQLIGRIDPYMDRKSKTLFVQGVFAEKTAPRDAATARAIVTNLQDLAAFLGAERLECRDRRKIPAFWRKEFPS